MLRNRRRTAVGPPRRAEPADVDLVTRLLVDAFADDPMWGSWAFPQRHTRREHREAVFRVFVAGALRYPMTWIADGDTAVAMWIPPGSSGVTPAQELMLEADLRARLGPFHAGRIFRAFDLFDALLPVEPHYYLSLLGTDPAHAGHGHGRRLLTHNLALRSRLRAATWARGEWALR